MSPVVAATVTDLSDSVAVDWFKREVAVPGTFTSTYPETSDDDVAGALIDGLYRAKLDGMLYGVDWMNGVDADPDSFELTTAIPLQRLALIVIYAGIRFVQNEIKNMATMTKYEAPGPLSAETQRSPGVLTERLRELEQMRKDLIDRARRGARGLPVFMHDGYAIRVEEVYVPEAGRTYGRSPFELL